MNDFKNVKLACWICSGVYSSFGYLKQLLKTLDILAVLEHWLYHDSLSFLDSLDENVKCFARSSALNDLNFRWRRGQGGVGIFLDEKIGLPTRFKLKGLLNLVISSVYFPSSNRPLSKFKKTLDETEQFFNKKQVENV